MSQTDVDDNSIEVRRAALVDQIYQNVHSITVEGKLAGAEKQDFKGKAISEPITREYTSLRLVDNPDSKHGEPDFAELSPYTIKAYCKVNGLDIPQTYAQRREEKKTGIRELLQKASRETIDQLQGHVFVKRVTTPSGESRVYFHQAQNPKAVDARGYPTFFSMSFDVSDSSWRDLSKQIENDPKVVRTLMVKLLPDNFEHSLNEPTKIIIEENTDFEPSLVLRENSQRNDYSIEGNFREFNVA